jgi:UDP-N-acetylmuramyl pentapeptide phosphotransferase/UDP-N-acetylglucosamine-1-phosphate transferase/tetratricopeptide (TPR) repeat protein
MSLPDEARLIAAFVLALGSAFAVTPAAIAVAARTNFHDRPVGYKGHSRPTPYLGGVAVLGGFLVAATLLGGEFSRLSPIVGCTCALWALGTLDDRRSLGAWPRVAVECMAAILLWSTGLGWDVFPGDAADLALTLGWVVGLVNAFNLIDNMDGAAATIAAVTSVAVGGLALIEGDVPLAILVFGLAGACLGFLPYNLASPARIFLGDGGSLPIGFVVAASLMAVPVAPELGVEHVLAATLLVGVPVLDTSLVSISRRRAGVSLWTGGRDHLTHRLQTRLGSARTVALSLGATQAALCAVAVGVVQLGRGSVVTAWSIWFVVVTAAIVLLESRSWAPPRGPQPSPRPTSGSGSNRVWSLGPVRPSPVEAVLIAFIAIACGLSPFVYGFYDVSVWGPIALGTLAALLGLLIARPAVPRPAALIAAAALLGLWLWALVSVGWSESADQAMTEANRWLLYAALFGVLVLLLSDDRLGAIVVGTGAAAIIALGLYLAIRLLTGSGDDLFLAGRLNEPLGYVNGQTGYLLMGIWPLVALAERARSALVAGAALAGATFLGALVLLGQTRAIIPAAALSALILLVAVPGRVKRAWALTVAAAGIAACIAPVLEVYDSVRGESPPADDKLRDAALAIFLASAAAGAVWAIASVGVRRLGERAARVGRFAWAPLAVGALFVVVLAFSTLDPVDKARDEYRAFVELEDEGGTSSRFTSGGGNRYDYWRIAVDQFADNPVRGIGAGNYDRTYFLERRSTEDIRQAHSIELQTLGELGIVGGSLLGAFLVAIGAGFVRHAQKAKDDLRVRALTVAAGGTFVFWLVHTSVDWLHLIPGLTGIALCSAAVLVGPWRPPRGGSAGRQRLAVVAICCVAVLAGAVLVGRAALADRYLNDGRDVLASDPAEAIAKAGDSQQLNDERLATYYLEGAGWARLGDYRRARAALTEATRREPHDFVTWALLGDLATRRGDERQALHDYRRALSLNPRSEALRTAVQGARARVSFR